MDTRKKTEKPKKLKLNLREVLSNSGLSRYELAKKLGLHYVTISSMINDEYKRVEVETLEKICLAMDVGISDLFVWE